VTSPEPEVALTESPAPDLQTEETTAAHSAQSLLSSLRSKALTGTAWTIGSYAGATSLRLISNIILSRLLVPQYFGLMTLLNTTIAGLILFSDLGLTPNVVRSSRGDEESFLNTAWTMQVLRGTTLWIICLIMSRPFAAFYGQPQLRIMVPVIGLSLVINSFNSSSLATLARHMAVRQLALMELSIQVVQLVFTIGWALIDRSVWALIAGRLFSDVVRLVVSHRMIRGRRTSFHWDKDAARELFAFGRWVFFSTALTFVASQSDRMILGKLVSLRTLGLYGIAFALSDIPRQVILSFCSNIIFPFVSKLAHLPRAEFFGLVLKYRQSVLLAAAGLLAMVVTTGDLFIVHVYDSRYHAAAWIVPILALGLWHTLLYATTNYCLWAVGKPHYVVTGYLCSAIAILVFIPIAFHQWGLLGAVWTVALSDLPVYFIILYGLGREGMYPVMQDLKMTLVFLVSLGTLVLVRLAAGVPFPHAVLLH
jgi:O-antigen/teichoic acid export membrane protein